MSMFDKDKEIGLIITNLFPLKEPFILWNAEVIRDDYPTDLGPAAQTRLVVSKRSEPNERYDTTTLAGAIAAKAREATPSDFPAIVMLAKVNSARFNNEALVLQYIKPYGSERETANPAPSAGDVAETVQES